MCAHSTTVSQRVLMVLLQKMAAFRRAAVVLVLVAVLRPSSGDVSANSADRQRRDTFSGDDSPLNWFNDDLVKGARLRGGLGKRNEDNDDAKATRATFRADLGKQQSFLDTGKQIPCKVDVWKRVASVRPSQPTPFRLDIQRSPGKRIPITEGMDKRTAFRHALGKRVQLRRELGKRSWFRSVLAKLRLRIQPRIFRSDLG